MRDTEEKLTELQKQYHALTQSYETLQLEYSAVKEELESLRSQNESGSDTRRNLPSGLREWDESVVESADPLMFDTSVLCYNVEWDRK
jgi:predicted nuclease with TOPRIM domain